MRFLVKLILLLFIPTSFTLFASDSSYKELQSAPITYKTFGEGPPLILIHGGPGHNSSYFLPYFKKLATKHQIIAYDQRGSNELSSCVDLNNFTMDRFVEDLECLRAELNIEMPSLIAHGWGALIAINYAIKYPQQVDKLVLMNPFPMSAQELSSFAEEIQSRLAKTDLFSSSDLDEANSTDFFKKLFEEFFYDRSLAKKMNFEMKDQNFAQSLLIFDIFEKSLLRMGYDYKAKLSKINAKTLILHGDEDPIPLWTVHATASAVPRAQLHVVKNCGHFSHFEKPTEFFDTLQSFLDK